MDSTQIRTTFRDFYTSHGHRPIIGSTLLPPPDDPVLYTTSGMHPLTPYLEGRPHPDGTRLVNLQRCLRTTDLDEVGDDTHLTVFGMLGTWSLGDYDGEQSLRWGYELLTDGFGIDPRLLHVTVLGGDGHVEPDYGSERVWESLGVPIEHTTRDNWWSNGPTGPCGPDSEIFYWTGTGDPNGTPGSNDRWMEIWNHVMMRYRRHDDGSLTPLVQRNVDTGMGLERLTMVLQGSSSVFDSDLFSRWRDDLRRMWRLEGKDLRVGMDHLRSSYVVIGDGVRPSNTGRGHVLRRLLRRTLTTLWRTDPTITLDDLPGDLVDITGEQFGMHLDRERTCGVLREEERRFSGLLRRGRPLVDKLILHGPIGEQDMRWLHHTHGLPRDLVQVLTRERTGSP